MSQVLTEASLTKSDVQSLKASNSRLIQEIRQSAYGVGDNLHSPVDVLRQAVKHDPIWEEELKIVEQMIKLQRRSKLTNLL